MSSSKYESGQSMLCKESMHSCMDCLFYPKIEQRLGLGSIHGLPAPSMDPCLLLDNPCLLLDNPWIVQLHTLSFNIKPFPSV